MGIFNKKTPGDKPTMQQAHLLMHLDVTTTPPKLMGLGRYSSREITMGLTQRTFVVLTGWGTSYQEGIDHLEEQLKEPYNKWVADWWEQDSPNRRRPGGAEESSPLPTTGDTEMNHKLLPLKELTEEERLDLQCFCLLLLDGLGRVVPQDTREEIQEVCSKYNHEYPGAGVELGIIIRDFRRTLTERHNKHE